MVLFVIRHGESDYNKEQRFTGWYDSKLNENGVNQGHIAGKLLRDYNIQHIFTSNLSRAIDTTTCIVENLDNLEKVSIFTKIYTTIPIENSESLNERNYGDLTGLKREEIIKKYGEKQVQSWRRGYYDTPPNGESLYTVQKRVSKYFDEKISPLLQLENGKVEDGKVEDGKDEDGKDEDGKVENGDEQNVLIVAHGNTIRALLVHLGIKTEKTIENCEIATGKPMKIDFINKTFKYENEYELLSYQIIDSRGFPTLEVKCWDKINRIFIGKGSSPSGASCGSSEVLELRDGDPYLYKGKSVFKAVNNVIKLNDELILNDKTIVDLINCDNQMIKIDGTEFKTKLGGNTTTAISFCLADTAAKIQGKELFEYIADIYNFKEFKDEIVLPTPFVNIINGGKHSVTGELKIQEFMIFTREDIPVSYKIQIICEVYHTLQKILVSKYGEHAKSIGDEGGFCPPIYTCEEALNVIEEAIQLANYKVGEDVFIALDCAASEFYNTETKLYEVEKGLFLNNIDLINYYSQIIQRHPALKSIEDGFHESDYSAWSTFSGLFSHRLMIVGDDLFTTNPTLIKEGIFEKWANALLLKVNQIGTISEAIEGAKLMFEHGNEVIVSHRSGETNHAYIVDIAVGIGAKYLKIGSPCRGERVAKFNRLLEIEAMLRF